MKDNRFIELVNLYVDRQITAEEAAELEAEMQNSPRRRAIYRQYCQMHRATALVYESFRADASEQHAADATENVVVARFDGQHVRRANRWIHVAGGLVAASLAVVLVLRLNPSRPADLNPSVTPKSAHPAVAIAAQPVPAPAVAVPEARTGPVSLRANIPAADQDYAALVLALRREEQRAFANGQIQPSRLPSLFEDGVFDSQQILPANNRGIFRPAKTPASQAEFTAFQFQR